MTRNRNNSQAVVNTAMSRQVSCPCEITLSFSGRALLREIHIYINIFCRSNIGRMIDGYETCQDKNNVYNYEENNQQNALIVSLINLLISNYSNMFRPLS
jgi:hypothetical protein